MKKVLIVEDNELLRTALGKGLLGLGFDVEAATNGQEGLEAAKKAGGDLSIILCDVMMPVMDGFQMLREIKQDPVLRRIPFVFLTAIGDLDRMEKGRELGVADFLIKDNVDLDKLTEVINKYA
ncbi:MAG: Response regulator receiver sensor signal transduction histidine kinase [candidate division CPR2 bacterium GW2011_GWC1_39_9]|uniref:Two-component response regulator, CheY subfamily n=1 Tax=candidate division CPR2 bacterium GW2011_GWC2_39_10 TaxID=1618345 RepID=A0A0G0LS48_UNCC2|nr:MAG: Two-component response regulator, CheY subfamily [candidate division CPR2 bacterium GW2011_GWC2_39_10]KKR33857.1 MAG: Response regulator receiver sensor signal transduction histidine kinase [candidate division CPR2 bacterium GW2011_GWC1_39_9]